jgi:Rha family phage regulatory protein
MENSERRLSGKGCYLNNADMSPMPILARDRLAALFVMNMHKRGVEKFPRLIDHNWSFGWTMTVLWTHRNRLVKANIEPTQEMLLEMLYGIVDENLLPFGASAELAGQEAEEEIAPIADGLGVFEKDGRFMVSSRTVAVVFGKSHAHVLRDIKSLDCSKDFHASNFGLVEYVDAKGQERPECHMTKDGLTFLVMGYTGQKAAQYKEAYINKFNEMEAELRAREAIALPSPMPAIEPPKPSKKFYMPEEAAEELGLNGYRVLYARMEALGMLARGKHIVPAPEFSKYVRAKTVGTKKGNKYKRVVITPSGIDYLRMNL